MQNVDALIINLRIVGATMIFLAVLHAAFAKRFHWGDELPKLSLLNRQIFYVHVLHVIFTVNWLYYVVVFGWLFVLQRQ